MELPKGGDRYLGGQRRCPGVGLAVAAIVRPCESRGHAGQLRNGALAGTRRAVVIEPDLHLRLSTIVVVEEEELHPALAVCVLRLRARRGCVEWCNVNLKPEESWRAMAHPVLVDQYTSD